MKKLFKEYHAFLKERFKGDILVFIIELVYVLFCLSSAIYFAVQGRAQNVFLCVVFPLIPLACCVFEWRFNVRGGALFYVIFFCMALSNVLGNGYGLYEIFYPYFDKIMHTLSGIVFTCMGFMLIKMVLGGDKKFGVCLLCGVLFAMAIASIWEVYEYFVTAVLHSDMQTDYVLNSIDFINKISQTIIYYENGEVEIIDGYLDIGLYDTLQDITVCLLGAVVTSALLILDHFCFNSRVKEVLIPKVLPRDNLLKQAEPIETTETA